MDDRELLELAAKAHGDLRYVPDGVDGWIHELPNGDRGAWWNPLTDDGDALRLAVKLGMHFECGAEWSICYAGSVCAKQFSERHGDDKYAATRRAIVRAAAEIGRAMP